MLPASLSSRWVPKDFVETSLTGGGLTLVAYVIMLVLFSCELWSFLKSSERSTLVLDHLDGPQLQINFDIDMYEIECRNLEVVVVDELMQSPIRSLGKHYELSTVDRQGRLVASHSTKSGADEDEDEEVRHMKTAERLKKEDGQQELDADWATSHDGFKHQSFEHVVQFHDFTLINFFAEWCVHCRKFAPTWNQIASEVKAKQFVDVNDKVREVAAIKMNCVDFQHVCRSNRIDAFPSLRLYKSDGTFSRYDGNRSVEAVVGWIDGFVHKQGHGMKKHHRELPPGCNLKGFLRVPRVPGHLELSAGGGDQNLDPTAANVSHAVKQLTFSEPSDSPSKSWLGVPLFNVANLAPINGRRYCTEAFHEAYEHHLKIVSLSTRWGGVGYLFNHYGRTARLNASVIPQARFFYDLEPFAISVQRDSKPWYDFVTSLLAILGGIFVVMRLLTMATLAVARVLEKAGHTGGASRVAAEGLAS